MHNNYFGTQRIITDLKSLKEETLNHIEEEYSLFVGFCWQMFSPPPPADATHFSAFLLSHCFTSFDGFDFYGRKPVPLHWGICPQAVNSAFH